MTQTARKRPRSVNVLAGWVDAYARQHGQPPARVRNWVSHMVLGGALERAGFDGAGRKFTIKGGVALEMRLRHLARATKDLDLVLLSEGDLIQELASALERPYEGFSFRLRGEPHVMPNSAVRTEVALQYLGKPWGTIQVDIARQEGGRTEIDMVDAISLSPFGLDGPETLPCLSLPYHVAQKIHAMTAPPPEGRRNDRFRDLVDLLLIREWITDFEAVQRACREVFELRGTHAWPPFFLAPDHWVEQYAGMAASLGMEVTDVHQAAHEVRAFISAIDDSAQVFRPVLMDGSLTAVTWFFAVGPDEAVRRIPAELGESLYIDDVPPTEMRVEWQREPGAVALIGVVMILENRRPLYVVRVDTLGRALSEGMDGKPVAFTEMVWVSLASVILRTAKAPERALKALAIFLSHAHGPLPSKVAPRARITPREMHKYFAPPHLPDDTPLWDIWSSELVRRLRPGRSFAANAT